jgi:hypothetical protein
MTDRLAYYLLAQSTFSDTPERAFRHRIESLAEYVRLGGRLTEDDAATFDFPQWLVDNNVPHHFEMIPWDTDRNAETLFAIHLYTDEDAFITRLHTNRKPMPEGWRTQWTTYGFDGFRKGLIDVGA